jgi:hypothetical protein
MNPLPQELEILKNEVDRLKSLLDNPEPGLVTWCLFVNKRVEAIVNWWNPTTKPESK